MRNRPSHELAATRPIFIVCGATRRGMRSDPKMNCEFKPSIPSPNGSGPYVRARDAFSSFGEAPGAA
jgi:hypothetical protein